MIRTTKKYNAGFTIYVFCYASFSSPEAALVVIRDNLRRICFQRGFKTANEAYNYANKAEAILSNVAPTEIIKRFLLASEFVNQEINIATCNFTKVFDANKLNDKLEDLCF